MAIKIAFRWEEPAIENIGLSGLLILGGIVVIGLSETYEIRSGAKTQEERKAAEVKYSFNQLMLHALIFLIILSLAFIGLANNEAYTGGWFFWITLPALFGVLLIKALKRYRLIRFLNQNGVITDGHIVSARPQLHHDPKKARMHIVYGFDVEGHGSVRADAECPYSAILKYEPGDPVQVIYDPAKPQHCHLLPKKQEKRLHSREE